MSPAKREFYAHHGCLMEPWDGPAAIPFTDGLRVGAVLDRNGLRPSHYTVTRDGRVIMASETGVLPVDPADVAFKGRLEPGRMFLVDLVQERIIHDDEIKQTMAIREKLVTSLATPIGREHNLFAETPLHCRQLMLPQPILRPRELAAIRASDHEDLRSAELAMCWPVAVVGSGPSGLACAQQLNTAGHAVTVFERDDRPGGLLHYGIPDFKLEKRVLDRRLEILRQEGIVFRSGVQAGV